MATRKAGTPPATRKSQAKKANAPMKNTPSPKAPKAEAKAGASRAARTMARTVTPGIRKSSAKRVESAEQKTSSAEDTSTSEAQMNELIQTLKDDHAAVVSGKGDAKNFRALILAVSRAVSTTKKKQGAK